MHLFRSASFLAICVAVGIATGTVSSQTATSPKGFDSTFGMKDASSSTRFGGFSWGRHMLIDAAYVGTSRSIKGVDFRPADRVHNPKITAPDHTWANVSLDVGESVYDLANQLFAKNFVTTPTRVYSSTTSWPALSGRPSSASGTWTISFPFTSTWNYSGKNAVGMDFAFSKGSTQNGGIWASSDLRYDLDGVALGSPTSINYAFSYGTAYGRSSRSCADGSQASAAFPDLQVRSYGAQYMDDTTLRGRIGLYTRIGSVAPNATCAMLIGTKLLATEIPFAGVTCNSLWIDTTAPHLVLFRVANSSGEVVADGGLPGGVPYSKGLLGTTVALQGAWNDSKTGALRLTYGAATQLNHAPPAGDAFHKRKELYNNVSPTQGFGSAPTRTDLLWKYR